MKASLGALIANVALIHGAGLVLLAQSQPDVAVATAHRSRPVQMRLVQAPAPHLVADTTPEQPADIRSVMAQDVRAPQAGQPSPPAALNTQAEASLADTPTDNQAPVEEYIPRPRLSTSPKNTTPVIVPFPPQFDGAGRFSAVLALYIDEDGTVRRVRVDESTLPRPMQDAAKQAFLQTHFKPGEVKGLAVKSLIRVEVVFDNTPQSNETAFRAL